MSVAPATSASRPASERRTISELRPGDALAGVFACVRKDRLTSRTGAPYLSLELRDRTGTLRARVFGDADFQAARFERGDLVRVEGRVERFRGEIQSDLSAVRCADAHEADPADFLPVAYRDLDELDGFLEHLSAEVHDRHLRQLLESFLGDDEFRAELRRAPCSRTGHHAYLGGLLEHTVAVTTLAQEVCLLHSRLRPDLLLASALLHDVGKTREFAFGAEIELSEEGRLVGHLALGHRLVVERIARLGGFPSEKSLALEHCILGHHGPEPLPGRRFGSAEAVALYRLNALDASVKGALEHGLG